MPHPPRPVHVGMVQSDFSGDIMVMIRTGYHGQLVQLETQDGGLVVDVDQARELRDQLSRAIELIASGRA